MRLIDRLLLFLIRRSYRVAQRLTIAVSCQVEGAAMRVPVLFGAGLQNLGLTPDDRPLAHAIERVLSFQRGGVVDIGCNIGHFLQLCLLVDRNRPYVGFDPSLHCSFYLERFIRDNDLRAHRVLALGLSDRPGAQVLEADSPFDVCASFSREAHLPERFSDRRTLFVERGDAILPHLGMDPIALVKIDVEGLELEVLRGMERTLSSQRPFLILEVLQSARLHGASEADPRVRGEVMRHRRERALALTDFLREHDYLFYRILHDGRLQPLASLDPGNSCDPREADHLILPREHEQAFMACVAAMPFDSTMVRAAA